jgi:putative hemolysin
MPTSGVIIAALLAAILLLVSGFASGSEIAFFSLSPTDVADMNPEKSIQDHNIQRLRDDSERTLATILITNNFVNVTIIMLCNYVFGSLVHFGPKAYWAAIHLHHGPFNLSFTALRRDYAEGLQPSESAEILS